MENVSKITFFFLPFSFYVSWMLQSNAEWRCNRYALTQHPYRLYFNRPFSSSLQPLFQGESKCEVCHEYQSKFILYRVITVTKNSHGDSLWKIDWRKLWMISPRIYQEKCGGVLQFLLKMKTLTGVKLDEAFSYGAFTLSISFQRKRGLFILLVSVVDL